MKANSWHHKLFHFHLSFLIWKVWKGSGKITKKMNILRMKQKTFFIVFEVLSFGAKIKN